MMQFQLRLVSTLAVVFGVSGDTSCTADSPNNHIALVQRQASKLIDPNSTAVEAFEHEMDKEIKEQSGGLVPEEDARILEHATEDLVQDQSLQNQMDDASGGVKNCAESNVGALDSSEGFAAFERCTKNLQSLKKLKEITDTHPSFLQLKKVALRQTQDQMKRHGMDIDVVSLIQGARLRGRQNASWIGDEGPCIGVGITVCVSLGVGIGGSACAGLGLMHAGPLNGNYAGQFHPYAAYSLSYEYVAGGSASGLLDIGWTAKCSDFAGWAIGKEDEFTVKQNLEGALETINEIASKGMKSQKVGWSPTMGSGLVWADETADCQAPCYCPWSNHNPKLHLTKVIGGFFNVGMSFGADLNVGTAFGSCEYADLDFTGMSVEEETICTFSRGTQRGNLATRANVNADCGEVMQDGEYVGTSCSEALGLGKWQVCELLDGQIDGSGHGGKIETKQQSGYGCFINEVCQPCADHASYRDPKGYACSGWEGYDCRQALENYPYLVDQRGEDTLIYNCPVSCGISCKVARKMKP